MQNRRDFLRSLPFVAAGAATLPTILSACSSPAQKTIGLQLYSLRDMVKEEGIQKTLEAVAKMGYKNLETADYSDGKIYGLAPLEFKKMVEGFGMKATSAHLSKAFEKEKTEEIMAWWDKAIETHNAAGMKYMVQPWMPVNNETTLDHLKMYCDYFTSVGYKTAAASIQFGYHNHDFEFRSIDGQVIYDFMLQNVSKNHVFFELDVYWCVVGKKDPVEYMKKYGDQIKVLHIKDEKEIGASGQIDFEPIFNQMYANNIKDWYVEVERYSSEPLISVQQSYDFLNKAAYVK